ncbi:EAL domain-containing protein [Pediococcus acidilactici]|uniref:Cyclic diguanylate phosphodiesterase (EAL) domain protein n=1 Tax=Pediococcus acidilactici DSM 20284 TaxID=862514 RepID=E0NH75_PEDAC|nr:EAL domain-containing protein [Pediococcus acidilactici]AZP89887.1 EAL domain-containing protein [Pediococcus acidilactici]EFL95221.1 cyclic diguanylate phosphodiesterase (EAL) domain protein [Pediococcus acidilactici DSM 20284]KRN14994.1 diguanylate cyclase phosphodiesterase domain 2 protein [Pediococcus acidilactici]MDG9738949.1 EAL domain-containing protein [Pediococcus acidilactici]NKZ16431.1 EAL domain-containing protein [Pediococcus acidilactici]
MTLNQLEDFLFWLAILMAVLTVVIIGVYFWKTRHRGGNYLRDPHIPLRYFIQKQVDRHGRITGYECLLRTQDAAGQWTLPQDFNSLPLRRVIDLLEDTFVSLPTEPVTLSIKLTYQQISSRDFEYFIRWAITKIEPMNLAVEISIKAMEKRVNRRLLRQQIQMGRNYGMQFAVNNVGSELNDLKSIEWLLPEIDILKASMRSFRKEDPHEWLDLNLQFWNRLARKNHIKLVLVGIENAADQALAEQLQIDARQGYLFGKPEDVHRGAEK